MSSNETPPNTCRDLVLYQSPSIPRSPVYHAPVFWSGLLDDRLYQAEQSHRFERFLELDLVFRARNRFRAWDSLQKGERYADLEYVYYLPVSSLVAHAPLAISYDIGCQLECLGRTEQDCFEAAVGCTDGEGIERAWAELNDCKARGKEMGAGGRQRLDGSALLRAKL
ncbi:hypothetical protein C8R43DRAFT_1122702 [Mycena crocata]|nr:hypothetical protein C8R43DRAFT_1122702 [Mycena crocata]